ETCADELLHGPRHPDLVDRSGEAYLSAVAAQQVALLDERPRDLLREEWVALGLLHDAAFELRRQCAARDAPDDLGGLRVRHRPTRQLREGGLHAPRRLMVGAMTDQHHHA